MISTKNESWLSSNKQSLNKSDRTEELSSLKLIKYRTEDDTGTFDM